MNVIRLLLAGIYRITQKAYDDYRVEKMMGSDLLQISESAKIFPSATMLATREKSIVIGNNTGIRGHLVTFSSGGRICIGDYSYVGENTQIWSEKEIIIGNRVLIAHNCNIFDSSTHPVDKDERHNQFSKIINSGFPVYEYSTLKKGKVIIEDDVWIAAGCTIHRGVHIAEGAIIAAGSVVTHDIPANVIAAGNPAKIIKHITKDKTNA